MEAQLSLLFVNIDILKVPRSFVTRSILFLFHKYPLGRMLIKILKFLFHFSYLLFTLTLIMLSVYLGSFIVTFGFCQMSGGL